MSVQIFWHCLSVQEFFKTSNWQGYSFRHQQLLDRNEEQQSWQCLTVEEFFTQNNWQGRSLASKSTITQSSSSLTLSVAEFFQSIVWEAKPQVAAQTIVISSPTSSLPSSVELKLTDLSNLF